MKTTALLVTGVDRIELVEALVPEPGPGEVTVEAMYTAISPGTEMRCLEGREKGGTFPFIPGYSMVGRVVARGSGSKVPEGTLVFGRGTEKASWPLLWGGHIAHAVNREENVFPLPANVKPLEAALAKLAAIAYRGVHCVEMRGHPQVAVVGLGAIGQLAARLHRLAGAQVVAADLNPERVGLAVAQGIAATVPGEGLVEAFGRLQPQGADIVVDSTGVPSVLRQAIQLGKPKGWGDAAAEPTHVVIQGSYPEDVVFDYHQAFAREISVHFPRDCQAHDIRSVIGLIADGRLGTLDLVSEECDPADAQRVYSEFRAAKAALLTAVFRWH